MKSKLFNLFIAAVFLSGAGILLYPIISDFWNQMQQDKIVSSYAETMDKTGDEEVARMWEEAREYNRNLLRDEIIIDPFDQVKEKKIKGNYEEALNPQNNGVMGTIEIPKIKVSLPVFHGTSEKVLQSAIGHLEPTSLPVGGEGTHAVLSGHRGLPSAKLFTDLDELQEGDVFYLHILNDTLAYQVDQIKVVEPHELEDLAIVSGQDYVTLVTCTPYSVNSHRLLVRGTRIPYEEAKEVEAPASVEGDSGEWLPYLILIPMVCGALVLWKISERKKRKGSRRKGRR